MLTPASLLIQYCGEPQWPIGSLLGHDPVSLCGRHMSSSPFIIPAFGTSNLLPIKSTEM